jgi:deoxyadenosine/deoxycytidine kinase
VSSSGVMSVRKPPSWVSYLSFSHGIVCSWQPIPRKPPKLILLPGSWQTLLRRMGHRTNPTQIGQVPPSLASCSFERVNSATRGGPPCAASGQAQRQASQ